MRLFPLVLVLYACAGMKLRKRVPTFRRGALRMALYDGDEVTRNMCLSAEMILVAPIEAIRMDEVQWVSKNLPKDAKTSVVSRSALIQGIDGTPFVQMADGILGSSFCVFVSSKDNERAYSVFSKWTRDLSTRIAKDLQKNPDLNIPQVNFYLSSKDGHCIRVPVLPFEDGKDHLEEEKLADQTEDDDSEE